MSFKTLHELDTGTVTILSFVPISDGASLEKCTTQALISASLGVSSDLEFNTQNQLAIKAGSVNSSKIAEGAITSEKILNGEIDLSKLKTTGESSIPVNYLKRRTVCLHVGNYYRDGSKKLADDTYNYNSSIDRYFDRTEEVVNSSDIDSLNDAWGGAWRDSTEVHIVEPFATLSAAARFAEFNYGPNINALFLIHGHVSATGSYDLNINKRISNINRWSNFNNVAIVSGSPPDWDSSDSHFMHYFQDGNTLARIDWDQDTKQGAQEREKAMALCFEGPNVTIAGINFVFSSATNFPNLTNKFIGGTHRMSGVRMASHGDVDNFVPYHMERFSKGFFGDKDMPNACNEFVFKEDGTLFSMEDNSIIYYAKESDNSDILIQAYSNNAEIKFARLSQSSKLDLGDNNTEVLIKSDTNLDTSVESIAFHNGRNTFISDIPGNYYLCGSGGFGFTNTDFDALYDNAGAISGPGNRANYASTTTVAGSLLSRHNSSSYKSGNGSLNAMRLTGEDGFKLAPSSRASNPYSDQ